MLESFSTKDRLEILKAQKHLENVARIMYEWEDSTYTEPIGKDYEEYYAIRIKELEDAEPRDIY